MLAEHLAAGLLDEQLRFLVGALAPGIVGIDDRPHLAEVLHAPRHAGGRDRVGVGAGAEREARALRAGHLGRLAGREVDRLELGRDRHRRQHHAGMHRADDELGIAALDQVAQLARAGSRVRFGVFGGELDLAAGDAAALVDDVDRGLGGLVVPEAPRRDHAGEVAVMADHDRPGGLREQVLGDASGWPCRPARRPRGGLQEAAAGYFSLLMLVLLPSANVLLFDSPR